MDGTLFTSLKKCPTDRDFFEPGQEKQPKRGTTSRGEVVRVARRTRPSARLDHVDALARVLRAERFGVSVRGRRSLGFRARGRPARARRRTHRPLARRGRRRPVSARAAVDPEVDPPEYQDDYRDWKQAKDDETEAFKRAAAAAGRADDFVVGARPLDEQMLSRLMLQLLQNHTRGIPAAALLEKVKPNMCLDGYKSILVGIGRTRQWALAREIVDWVRAQGVEQGAKGEEVLTSNWFVALIRRRVDDGEWEPAVEVFEYMRDFGGVPSGECIEMFALVTDNEASMSEVTVARCRSLAKWLAESDAGRTLWHLSFGTPGMETQEVRPSKVIRVAMPSEEVDLNGDIDKLREQFKDYLQ